MQILYILVFKSEPLIKVGLAENVYLRSRDLGLKRFDLQKSYIVRSKDQPCIRTLERNLKTFFALHQTVSLKPMSSGNTETFHSSALSEMLQTIETFRSSFSRAEFQIERDISTLLPPAPIPKVLPLPPVPQVTSPVNDTAESDFYRRARTVEEVAEYVGRTPLFVRNEILTRRLRAHKLSSRMIRLMPTEIKRWIDASATSA